MAQKLCPISTNYRVKSSKLLNSSYCPVNIFSWCSMSRINHEEENLKSKYVIFFGTVRFGLECLYINNSLNSGLDKILTVNREIYSTETSVASPTPDKDRIITRARRNITAIYQIFGNT